MLYIFDELNIIDDVISDSMLSLLSKERCEKAGKLLIPSKKKASIAVYLLLRLALLENYGIDEAVSFIYSDKGKPLLRDYPNIHFNLSHSDNVVVCAVSDFEIGVDVQNIRPVSDAVARRVLTGEEYTAFKASPIPDEYFCGIWTVKESFLKQSGQGITVELRDISADEIKTKWVFRGKDYFCCVCGYGFVKKRKMIGRKEIEKLYNR
ncbi:MAG: 4'-phosphopantetheinyl transferase superfamily protein [Oscillospiraceae bacterium]|jgi:4'-phosphopantetheinyl transferase|nr:4'-phosphopantetheinyl transferase superfamily protein [Oscillospiraceae bacterium]